MDDLISRQAAIDAVDEYDFDFPNYMERFVTELRDAMKADIKHDIEALPSADVVTHEVVNQIKWERDTAISQLKDLGYGLGEKIRMDGDTINRQAALDAIYRYADNPKDKEIYKAILALPSAQPHDCNTCRYNDLKWYEEPCDSCTGGGKSNHWKPSADIVEVVRCKDCKYYDPKECCVAFGDWFGEVNMIPMGFCSLGERREE